MHRDIKNSLKVTTFLTQKYIKVNETGKLEENVEAFWTGSKK